LGVSFGLFTAQPVINRFNIREALPVRFTSMNNRQVHSRKVANIPNSETKRPDRISQLCQGSWVPCQTFPERQKLSNLFSHRRKSFLTLMKISIVPVRRSLSMTAVRRSPMIMDITKFVYHFWQNPFVNISSREISLAKISCFVRIVEFKTVGFSKLII
jgi:hypothetical protein